MSQRWIVHELSQGFMLVILATAMMKVRTQQLQPFSQFKRKGALLLV
jgi:hypothetical protein